jgi:basic amino acid/polyamine antiporter, APA family
MTPPPPRALRRILGLAFGLALVFGTMVGVGILRLPGTVAAALHSPVLIMSAWILGGVFSLVCAVSVAELAAMIPESGGFRTYARRAFGEGTGFVVGCTDWLSCVTTLAYGTVTAAAFLGVLWPPAATNGRLAAVCFLVVFTGMHWIGLRVGSVFTEVVSVAMGLLFVVLILGCFFVPFFRHTAAVTPAVAAPSPPMFSAAMLLALGPALRALVTAYDGWYGPIYMAEENTDAARTLPRAIIGGTLLVVTLYLTINLAFLHVLPVTALASSLLPAADAARIVLPRGSAEFVTVLSLLTVLSLINSNMLYAPRVLFAIGRDGLVSGRTAAVSESGTPRPALVVSALACVALVLTGTFDEILSLYAVLILVFYISAFASVFVLRRAQPGLPRPYKAFGYPYTTGIALVSSVALLIAAVADDLRTSAIAAGFLVACGIAYWWLAGRKRARLGA